MKFCLPAAIVDVPKIPYAGETIHSHIADADEAFEPEVHVGHRCGDLQQTARDRENVLTAFMETLKTHSLGQIPHRMYDVSGN